MMTLIDDEEPRPIIPPLAWRDPSLDFRAVHPMETGISAPTADFFGILHSRRSHLGKSVDDGRLASLLWHVTQLRERRLDGRFGKWESRTSASAGGLHPIALLIMPVSGAVEAGLYLPDVHALGIFACDLTPALVLNAASVRELSSSTGGTTIQLVADTSRIAACYTNWQSLLWRDAGALTTTICLTATAIGLTSLPLGRHGTDIVRASGLQAPFIGVGAIHIGDEK